MRRVRAPLAPGVRPVRRRAPDAVSQVQIIYLQGIGVSAFLALWYFLVLVFFRDAWSIGVANTLGPIIFFGAMGITAWRVIGTLREAIWSPLFLIPLQSGVFYGFGPLVEVFGDEGTQLFLSTHIIQMSPEQLVGSHLLSTLGITLLLSGMLAHMLVFPDRWRGRQAGKARLSQHIPTFVIALTFGMILFGGAFRHLIVKPAEWGMIDLLVAGAATKLSAIVDVGFGILTLLIGRGRRSFIPVFLLLWPPHLFLVVLSLAKFELVITLLFPVIGYYAGRRRVSVLVTNLALIAFAFMLSQDWVHYGRQEILERTQTISQAGYSERIDLLSRFVAGDRNATLEQIDRQGWWTRLSFAREQSFAMRAYDSGDRSDSLEGAWVQFIPRAIWSEKPIIIGPGAEFYETVTGRQAQTFLGLSIYGDLYWQFGWFGLVVGCFLIGLMFAMLSWRSQAYIRDDRVLRLPLVLIAFEMAATGPNQFVTNAFVGSGAIYLAYFLLLSSLDLVQKPPTGRPVRRRPLNSPA